MLFISLNTSYLSLSLINSKDEENEKYISVSLSSMGDDGLRTCVSAHICLFGTPLSGGIMQEKIQLWMDG